MKRCLIFLLVCFLGFIPAYSQDDINNDTNLSDINLDLQTPTKTYNLKRKEIKNPETDKYKNYDDDENDDIQDFSLLNPNMKHTFKIENKKKLKKDISVGNQSTHSTTADTYSGTNTMYAEYEKKNFKLNTGYTTSTSQNQSKKDNGSVSVSPEYKINNHFSVQNKNSINLNDNSQKTELNLKVKPCKDDRLDLGVGVGQKNSTIAPSSSQVNFSTNFKF